MSDVGPVSSPSHAPPARAELDRPTRAEPAPARIAGRAADRLEISEMARLLARMREPQPVRIDLVERIRGEIAGDTYETPDKVNAAVDAILQDLELAE